MPLSNPLNTEMGRVVVESDETEDPEAQHTCQGNVDSYMREAKLFFTDLQITYGRTNPTPSDIARLLRTYRQEAHDYKHKSPFDIHMLMHHSKILGYFTTIIELLSEFGDVLTLYFV